MDLSYTVDQNCIDAALQQLEPEPRVCDIMVSLSGDQCVEENFDKGYLCGICNKVAFRPS